MEALYDTSVLINAYRQNKQLKGYTTILNVIEFPKSLEMVLTVIYPSKQDYNLAVKLSKDLLKKGKPIPGIDLIIAAVAMNRNLTLITSDKHFEVIRDIRSDFTLKVE